MTSPISAKHDRTGFTVTELLVVLGIIAALFAILLPVVFRAMRSGERAKTAALIQTISVGLDAFYADHQEYPDVVAGNTGAVVLGRSLIAPGPADDNRSDPAAPVAYSAATAYSYGAVVYDAPDIAVCISTTTISGIPTSTTASWYKPFAYPDGASGVGFRKRSAAQGPVYSYLAPERVKINGVAILDAGGSPILYYPGRPQKPNINIARGYISNVSIVAGDPPPMYRSAHGNNFLEMRKFRYLMGDVNNDGGIGAQETAAFTGPYLLWSAGPDGVYGPADYTDIEAARCDDVTSFR